MGSCLNWFTKHNFFTNKSFHLFTKTDWICWELTDMSWFTTHFHFLMSTPWCSSLLCFPSKNYQELGVSIYLSSLPLWNTDHHVFKIRAVAFFNYWSFFDKQNSKIQFSNCFCWGLRDLTLILGTCWMLKWQIWHCNISFANMGYNN